jgi:glucose-6-phosphate-specific signal transduction histidine kinase
MALFPTKRTINVSMVLLCTFLCAVVWAAAGFGTLYLARMTPETRGQLVTLLMAFTFFLGGYLGSLTVVPMVLAAKQWFLDTPAGTHARDLKESRLTLEALSLLAPSLILLVWVAVSTTGDMRQIARIAMFLPAAWLALRHGWRGTAVGASAASIAVMLTMMEKREPSLIQAEAFIAFAITSLLMLSARITVLNDKENKGRADGQMALRLAQESIYLGEMRMRQTAYALEQLGSTIQQAHNRFTHQLRYLMPTMDESAHHRNAIETQQQVNRLADSLYPRAWRNRGLPTALRVGPIAQVLADLGTEYGCELGGRGLSVLSPNVQLALYRLASESVVYLFAQRKAYEQIKLTLRGGETRGRRWAVLRLEGSTEHEVIASTASSKLDELVARLGANGLALSAIRSQALIYGGELHLRVLPRGLRVTVLIHDSV